MIRLHFNVDDIVDKTAGTANYVSLFMSGIGKSKDFEQAAAGTAIDGFYKYLDSRSMVDSSLHHAYERGEQGQSESRLYDVRMVSRPGGTLVELVFLDSVKSIDGYTFTDRARVLEEGRELYITPIDAPVLSFLVEGDKRVYAMQTHIEAGSQKTTGRVEEEFNYYMTNYASRDIQESGFVKMTEMLIRKEVEKTTRKGVGVRSAATKARRSIKNVTKGLRGFAGL